MLETMTDAAPAGFRTPRRRIFNPLRLTDEEVERSFIARRPLFASLLADISAETGDRPPQHHLIVGQRGMGKTTLLCRIAAELRKPDHQAQFLPLTFPEEQYIEIDRLSKFWLNCLDAMADALEAMGDRATAADLDAQVRQLERGPAEETVRADEARAAFQAAIDRVGRRPVLLLDNLHLLLQRLREHDYVLRGFFTRRGAPVLVGAAAVVPESLQDYGAAFYDSFKTHVLHRLSVGEMRDIIVQLAREANRPDVAARLHAELPRLRALRDLTGGNPRTTVLLFELFAQGFSDDPYEDLEALLDQVTPLYQSRLDQLSEQAQLLFAALARQWSPATAEQLTAATQLPRGSISPQLGRLEAVGLVEKAAVFPGKKTGYQIAERFFNIWYLMRFASRRQRTALECLTRFLQGFYTPPELEGRARRVLQKAALSGGEATYALALADAISQRGLAHDLRTHAELLILRQTEGIREQIAQIIDPTELSPQAIDFDEQRRRLRTLVPDDSPISPDEFAELVLSCVSLVPPRPEFDRRSLVTAERLSREQVEEHVRIIGEERRQWIEAYSEDAVAYVMSRLRCGSLPSWMDQDGLRSAIEQSPTAQSALLLGDLAITKVESADLAEQAYRQACELDPMFASSWNALGNLLQDQLGRYEEAEQAYRHACQLDPKDAYPWNDLGNLLQNRLGRYEEAEQAYRHASELDPKYASPWNNLANLLQGHLGRYEEAEQAYRHACELDPKSWPPWNNLGNLLKDHLGRYEEAEQAYRHACELDPKSSPPWNGLGNLLMQHLGRYEEAEQAYRHACELDPKYAYPWNNLGNLLKDHLGRYQEAEQAYRHACQLDPKDAYPWNDLGNLLKDHLGRYQEAEQAYRRVCELDPKSVYAWNNLGNLLQQHLGRYEEAEQAYRHACELDPKSVYAWNNLGYLLQQHLGRYEEAERAYRHACELDPNDAVSWANLGNLLQNRLGRYEEAERAYRRACELNPTFAYPWNGLGDLLTQHLGRYDEAEKAYRHACELDSKYASPWNGLGYLLHHHLRRYQEAEHAYLHACELEARDAYPWSGLGYLLMDCLGRHSEAEQAYCKALEIDPAYDPPRHGLVFLLRDLCHDFSAARRFLTEFAAVSFGKDTRALHEALFAAYDGKWGSARESLRAALAEVADSLPVTTRDDWYRASAVFVHLGFGPQLLEFLVEQGADVRLMPWFEAVRAHVVGDERHLGNIPAEARAAAGEIYAAIERWRRLLPSRP